MPVLPFKLVYHPEYDLDLGGHVFPSAKYRLVRERLIQRQLAMGDDFVEPSSAPDADLHLAHTAEWIRRLRTGSLTWQERMRLEVPYTPAVVRGFLLAAGGSTLAARMALEDGFAVNIGGGFHHAYPGHGEGFCAVNDIAVAIRTLQRDSRIATAMVVDCDVHHGNGTAAVFAGDASVFTLSIHQLNNYPDDKPPSTLDIHLEDGVGDDEYLSCLEERLVPALAAFRPDLLIYVAGADPYIKDQLGGLNLTTEGLKQRDALVFQTAMQFNVAVAVVLAGGYAPEVDDTVTIHVNTIEAIVETRRARQ